MTARDTAATTIGAHAGCGDDCPQVRIQVRRDAAKAAKRPQGRRIVMLTPDIADVLAGVARESCR